MSPTYFLKIPPRNLAPASLSVALKYEGRQIANAAFLAFLVCVRAGHKRGE